MSALSPADLATVSELLGADIAQEDAPGIAASIADLRDALPEFRRVSGELLATEGQDD
ncbi:hypothetical protein [Microbacterium sp. YJN-G]|uniref:hypothetical protein n=1 Tax=Microbacterium sp. YJN-G TaxID=2763257 RepID=UPI0018777C25|nr:hypothetical protein [Microbacterium sp. YJN-G]